MYLEYKAFLQTLRNYHIEYCYYNRNTATIPAILYVAHIFAFPPISHHFYVFPAFALAHYEKSNKLLKLSIDSHCIQNMTFLHKNVDILNNKNAIKTG